MNQQPIDFDESQFELARRVAQQQAILQSMEMEHAPTVSTRGGMRQRLAKWIGGNTVSVIGGQTVQVVSPVAQEAQPPRQGQIPLRWSYTYMPPGRPITPLLTSYESVLREYEPRTFQYPPNINATIAPRLGYGLTPFYELKYYSENVPEMGMCRRILTEELKSFIPQLIHIGDETPVDVSEECPELEWMVTFPDRKTPWPIWLSRFMYNVLVYDAPALYNIFDRSGRVVGLRTIDGSTLFALIDDNGETPAPPAPAIVQIYFGAPRAWMTSEQLWYTPRHLRADAPYGIAPYEDARSAVQLLERLWSYEMAEVQEGNIPESLIAGPVDWSPEKLLEWEERYNNFMAGSAERRMRMRFIPSGFTKVLDKDHSWSPERYDAALKRVGYVHGIPPSEMGDVPGQGLGGKGFQEAMQSQFYRMGIGPLKSYIESPFNDVLAKNGYDKQYRWELAFPQISLDPMTEHDKILTEWQTNLITMDEARSDLKRDATETDFGDKLYIEIAGAVQGSGQGEGGLPGTGTIGSGQVKVNQPITVSGSRKIMVRNGQRVNVTGRHNTLNVKPATIQVAHDGGVQVRLDKREKGDPLGKAVQEIPGLRHASPDEVGLNVCGQCQFHREFGQNGSTTWYCWLYDSKVADDWTCDSWERATEHPDALTVAQQMNLVAEEIHPTTPPFEQVGEPPELSKNDHSGAMVALYLPEATTAALHEMVASWRLPPEAELEDPSSYHVTLAYFPDAAQTDRLTPNILGAMQVAALSAHYAQLRGELGGLGVFNQDDGRSCLYASLDAPELPQLRQNLVTALQECGVFPDKEHGFSPHVTLAYLPEGFVFEQQMPNLEVSCDALSLTVADGEPISITLGEGYTRLGKRASLAKHCGVCDEDDLFFGAPVIERGPVLFPKQGANETRIVAIRAHGAARPALWKPVAEEHDKMRQEVGGQNGTMASREEAAYVLDRSLGFNLVPVAYMSNVNGEDGAVLHYVTGRGQAKPPEEYAPEWQERAAVEDYIMGQTDRRRHNWLTHPDEEDRPILIDNGLAFPIKETPRKLSSAFVTAASGHKLSEETWEAVDALCDDATFWEDIADLLGSDPTEQAHARACQLRDERSLPQAEPQEPLQVADHATAN